MMKAVKTQYILVSKDTLYEPTNGEICTFPCFLYNLALFHSTDDLSWRIRKESIVLDAFIFSTKTSSIFDFHMLQNRGFLQKNICFFHKNNNYYERTVILVLNFKESMTEYWYIFYADQITYLLKKQNNDKTKHDFFITKYDNQKSQIFGSPILQMPQYPVVNKLLSLSCKH